MEKRSVWDSVDSVHVERGNAFALAHAANRFRQHLRNVGIDELPEGERVLLVAPSDLGWITALAEALQRERGSYPLLVQPSARRTEVGQPGPLRVMDMEAYLLDQDARVARPWDREDDSD